MIQDPREDGATRRVVRRGSVPQVQVHLEGHFLRGFAVRGDPQDPGENQAGGAQVKGIQRQLRDHYRGIANQTTRSLNESLQATLNAARMEETERNNRIAELKRQLNILKQVVEHAEKMMAGAVACASSSSLRTDRD